jgi:hypothetical protein
MSAHCLQFVKGELAFFIDDGRIDLYFPQVMQEKADPELPQIMTIRGVFAISFIMILFEEDLTAKALEFWSTALSVSAAISPGGTVSRYSDSFGSSG